MMMIATADRWSTGRIIVGNWTFHPFVSSSLDVSPPRRFAPWSYSTFPAYSVKTQAPGAKRIEGETSRGELTKGRKVHESYRYRIKHVEYTRYTLSDDIHSQSGM